MEEWQRICCKQAFDTVLARPLRKKEGRSDSDPLTPGLSPPHHSPFHVNAISQFLFYLTPHSPHVDFHTSDKDIRVVAVYVSMSVSGPALRKAEFLCDFASVLLDHPEFPFLLDGDELHRKQVSLLSMPYAETPGSEQMLGSYTISPSLMIPSVFAAQGNASSLLLPVMASIATLAGSTHLFPPCICDQAQLLGQARLANQSPDRRPEPHLVCLARLVQDRSVGTHLERPGFVDSPTRGLPIWYDAALAYLGDLSIAWDITKRQIAHQASKLACVFAIHDCSLVRWSIRTQFCWCRPLRPHCPPNRLHRVQYPPSSQTGPPPDTISLCPIDDPDDMSSATSRPTSFASQRATTLMISAASKPPSQPIKTTSSASSTRSSLTRTGHALKRA